MPKSKGMKCPRKGCTGRMFVGRLIHTAAETTLRRVRVCAVRGTRFTTAELLVGECPVRVRNLTRIH